jgi:hypothetical protein
LGFFSCFVFFLAAVILLAATSVLSRLAAA